MADIHRAPVGESLVVKATKIDMVLVQLFFLLVAFLGKKLYGAFFCLVVLTSSSKFSSNHNTKTKKKFKFQPNINIFASTKAIEGNNALQFP